MLQDDNKKRVNRLVEWALERTNLENFKDPEDMMDKQNDAQEVNEEIKEDAKLEVEISKDLMCASIYVIPPKGGKMISFDDVLNELKKKGIVEGINYDLIRKVLENGIFFTKVKIAEGSPPVDGQNGQIKYYFDIKKEIRPSVSEDGRVDFHDLNLVTNVKSNELLAEIIPPTKGKPGKTVTGKLILARDGKEVHFKTGKNVSLSEDGKKLFSKIDGQPVLSEGKISVLQVLDIKGDVGPATGNINFLGSIIVRGNVKSGYTIKVEGDAEIDETVEAARIEAGGNIVIKRGIQGGGKGYIKALGDVNVRYIENATVEAGENIIIYEAAMHSNLSAGKKIKIDGKKGLLVGGKSAAGEELIAKIIGSPMATYTEIEVGANPQQKKRLVEINQKLEMAQMELIKIDQAINLLGKMNNKSVLSQDKLVLLEKLREKRELLSEQTMVLMEEKQKLIIMSNTSARAKVSVSNAILPGVNIIIGNASLKIKDRIDHATFYNYEGQIKFTPYEG